MFFAMYLDRASNISSWQPLASPDLGQHKYGPWSADKIECKMFEVLPALDLATRLQLERRHLLKRGRGDAAHLEHLSRAVRFCGARDDGHVPLQGGLRSYQAWQREGPLLGPPKPHLPHTLSHRSPRDGAGGRFGLWEAVAVTGKRRKRSFRECCCPAM